MSRTSALYRRGLVVVAFVLASACSDGSDPSAAPCSGLDCALDAGFTGEHLDASRRDGTVRTSPAFMFDGSVDDELQARIQVNGERLACGACAILVVQAQGGQPPYSYEWSDPDLKGPGPLQVCPDAPTSYAVTVTDSSATPSGEFSMPAQSVTTQASIDCLQDAGTDASQGCFIPQPTQTDAGVGQLCTDAGLMPGVLGLSGTQTASTKLSDAFTNLSVFQAGKTYSFSTDRLLPFNLSLGKPVTIEIWGGSQLCEPAEKLVSVTFDLFSWHQSSCFTPTRDYPYIVETITFDGQLVYWDFLDTVTICDGCQP